MGEGTGSVNLSGSVRISFCTWRTTLPAALYEGVVRPEHHPVFHRA